MCRPPSGILELAQQTPDIVSSDIYCISETGHLLAITGVRTWVTIIAQMICFIVMIGTALETFTQWMEKRIVRLLQKIAVLYKATVDLLLVYVCHRSEKGHKFIKTMWQMWLEMSILDCALHRQIYKCDLPTRDWEGKLLYPSVLSTNRLRWLKTVNLPRRTCQLLVCAASVG